VRSVGLCAPALCALLLATAQARADEPRLVLLLAIDQLAAGRIDPELPGGLGRLAREGRVYTHAVHDHATTATCPGHATMLTGRHPGPAGIPGNTYIERRSGERVYCVADDDPEARVLPVTNGGDEEAKQGRSPRKLRVDGLGAWMKSVWPGSRIHAVSGKDRAAIVLGGRGADGAWWPAVASLAFTTSGFYVAALPAWVESFNAAIPSPSLELPERWVHLPEASLAPRRDDYPAESDRFGRTSGHALRDDDPAQQAERVLASPWADRLTLQFALRLVREEGLGRGEFPDLLAVGLSATDRIGHLWGPDSHEALDGLLRLDADLASFLADLEREVGAGRLLVALTSDHGVLPLPEWLAETGRSVCPVQGGRSGALWLQLGLGWTMHWSLSPLSFPRAWAQVAGSQLTVPRDLAESRGVEVERAVAVAKSWLEARDEITHAWTVEEIQTSDDPHARLFRNSYDPERSGDLNLVTEPTCLISLDDGGTGHGSPHDYDREVPIVFWGPGLEPGSTDAPARTVDIAPTLARILGLEIPDGLDGQPLW
jgi:predicted AlkP superfamily pyrophosphatase or phosphodiesterase